MSRYMLIRRLRGPAFLLLVGALALLNQADILSWGKSWPFFLILAGVLALAERAALAGEDGYPPAPYGGTSYPGSAVPPGSTAQPGNAMVPAHTQDYDKTPGGGQS